MDRSGASRDPKGGRERTATDPELFGSVVHPSDSVAKAVRKVAVATSGTAVVGIVGTTVGDVCSVEGSSPVCPEGNRAVSEAHVRDGPSGAVRTGGETATGFQEPDSETIPSAAR